MKFTKSELLFVLYVILTVVNSISGVFNSDYSDKMNQILNKLAFITDEASKDEKVL